MSPNVIFVAGVHGVGKTTYCKELSNKLNISHFSASDIIRSEKSNALKKNSKDVKDTSKNQDLLIDGLKSQNLTNKKLILDGHFVLIQGNNIVRIPLSTYKALWLKKIILLKDEPTKILQRIIKRDNRSQFTVELIEEMQRKEILYAKEVAKILGLELEAIKVVENC